jgi:hypothetical protein
MNDLKTEWSLNPEYDKAPIIPRFIDFKVVSEFDHVSETLKMETIQHGRVLYREIANFKDKKLREALIQLGWTPPPNYVAQESKQLLSMEIHPRRPDEG